MKRLIHSTTVFSAILVAGCAHVGTHSQQHSLDSRIPLNSSPRAAMDSSVPPASIDAPDPAAINTVTFSFDEYFKHQTERVTESTEGGSGKDDTVIRHAEYTSNASEFQRNEEMLIDVETAPPIEPFSSGIDLSLLGDSQTKDDAGYTLAEIEQIALANNPAIAAANATASKADGYRNQVGLRPNPSLGYFGQQIADRNTDQHGIYLEQEFVRGRKLQLNREALGYTSRAQRLEIETLRYRVLTDVRVRFFEALAAQQQADATQRFVQDAQRGVEVAEDRQEAEEGSLIETLQARTLLAEITLVAEQAAIAYRGAWQDLAAIAGLQQTTSGRLGADLNVPVETPDWQRVYAEIVMQSPELSAARALVCEKQALLKRQRVQAVPNVTAQFGAGHDRATNHGLINMQVSAPIPVFNKNTGNISAGYADYVRATQNVRRIEQSIRSRLARVAQDFDSALAAVRKYEQKILPQAQQSLDLSEEAYRAGELEFLQVLIVRQSFYESSIRSIQAKGQLAQAAAKIDGLLLTGGLDAPADYTSGDGLRGASLGGQ